MPNLKSLLSVLVAAVLLLLSQLGHARHAALLIDADNGDVLYELEANQSWYPASLTKLMTLYMAFAALESGRIRLSEQLNVSSHAAHQPTSKLGLRPWSTISVEDAILAVITRSANDAAVVLAERLGGSERQFAANMTSVAHRLGMFGSHFMNATGLPHDWQTTTAHDMALLAYKILRDFSQYYPYFGVDSLYFNGRYLTTSNKFVLNYPGAEGMKTGYTCGSGYNLVATANMYGKRLIGVVLGGHTSYERYQQMFTMMDIGFGNEFGSYRGRNINTMNHHAVGTPPYQLSCGHRPSSHYASRHHFNEDEDDTPVRYVKKNLQPKRTPVKAKLRPEPKLAKEITTVRIAGKTKTIVKTKTTATARHVDKAKPSKRDEIRTAKLSERSKSKSIKASAKTSSKSTVTTKSAKAKASTEKAMQSAKTGSNGKGYYTPKNVKAVKTTAKGKGYYNPDKAGKAVAKTSTEKSGRKTSKKKS